MANSSHISRGNLGNIAKVEAQMSSFILLGATLIAIVKWFKSNDLQNRVMAISLCLSSIFLLIRTYFYRPEASISGYEVIFLYVIWLVAYIVIHLKDFGHHDE